jgi:hypothetical protein
VSVPEGIFRWAPAIAAPALAEFGRLYAGETNLQETMPLVWAMVVISAAGAAITFGVLTYALWKFRDPAAKGRRYG